MIDFIFEKVSGKNWIEAPITIKASSLEEALEKFGSDEFSKTKLSKCYFNNIYSISTNGITLGCCHKSSNKDS